MQYLTERDMIIFRLDLFRRDNFGGNLENQCKAHGELWAVAKDAFYTMLFAVVTHSAGVQMTPFPQETRRGRIGEGEQTEQMLIALQRGAAMNTDCGKNWIIGYGWTNR